jgi:hypothetical protein
MTVEKRNEISFKALVKKMADDNEIPNVQNLKRDVPNEAKKLGITVEESEAFVKELVPHIIATRLGLNPDQIVIKW